MSKKKKKKKKWRKIPLPKSCYTYPKMMKLGTIILYLKMIQKIHKSRDISLDLCWHQHLSLKICNFCYIRKWRSNFVLKHFLNLFDFYWVFKGCFNQHDCNFDNFSKNSYSSCPKIKVFWKKDYDFIISVHNNTNWRYLRGDFFEGWSWFKFNKLGLVLGMALNLS